MNNVSKKVNSACVSRPTLNEDLDANSRTESDVLKQGWMEKRGGYFKGWRSRFFVLRSDGTLQCFKTSTNNSRLVNHFNVRSCQVVSLKQPVNTICIRFAENFSRMMFRVSSDDEKASWFSALKTVSDSRPLTQRTSLEELPEKVSFSNLKPLNLLGSGSYGRVYLCRDKSTSKLYAVKKLVKEKIIEQEMVEATNRENRILKSTYHPFLISLERSYQNDENLYFVMEFANGGDLYFHLMASPKDTFTEERAGFYTAELVVSLTYLHNQGIIYRDLKLENVLLDRDGHIKIADFGLSKDGMSRESRTSTFCGTSEYLAPEVIIAEDGSGYGFSADWWSLGVIVYEMVLGRQPFCNEDHYVIYQMILNDEPSFSKKISPEVEDLIRGLLVKDPRKRLGSGSDDGLEVMGHKFFAAVDWAKINQREVAPPFVPELSSDTDLRYFEAEYTEQETRELASSASDCSIQDVRINIGDGFEDFEYVSNNQD